MNARTELARLGAFDEELAAMYGQRVNKKLSARIKDYDTMTSHPNFKAPVGAFTKPGSNKK